MRKLIAVLIVLILFFLVDVVVAQIVERDASSPQEAVQKLWTEMLTRELAFGMKWKLHLPQKVDDQTYLEDIRAEKNMVIYVLGTNTDGSEFDNIMQAIHANEYEMGCGRADYRQLLSYGLAVAIRYRSSGGREVTPIQVTPQMCGAH